MRSKKAIKLVQEQIKQIENLRRSTDSFDSSDFKRWKKETEITLRNIFDEKSDNLKDFKNIRYYPLLVTTDKTPRSEINQAYSKAYFKGLDEANIVLNAIVREIRQFGTQKKKIGTQENKWFSMNNPFVYFVIGIAIILIASLLVTYFVLRLGLNT